MFITIEVDTDDPGVAAMLQRVLQPVGQALGEAIKAELAGLTEAVKHSQDLAETAQRDFCQCNELRIAAENELASHRSQVKYLEGQVLEQAAAKEMAQAEAKKWEQEAYKVIADADKTIGAARQSAEDKVRIAVDKYNAEVVRTTELETKLERLQTGLHDLLLTANGGFKLS